MAEEEPGKIIGAPVWGIFLVFLGVVFLLQTLNVLPWGLWGTLWRFWPVLIISIGLGVLLRGRNPWLVGLLILVILCACLGIAIWQYGLSPPAGITTENYSRPLADIEHGRVEVDFTAGSITIGSLPAASPNFVEVASGVRDGQEGMRVRFNREDGEGELYLSTERVDRKFWGGDEMRWDIRLTRSIPLAIDIKSAASNMELMLGELRVTEFHLDVDAGNCRVTMPSSVDITRAYIEADVANVEITIPDGVAARIWVDADLSALDVDESRFPKRGDSYTSDNFFDTDQKRIELEIDSAVGRVQVK